MLDLLLICTQYDPRQFSAFAKNQLDDALGTGDIPHIGLAYLLAVAEQHDIKARVINLIADDWNLDSLLKYVERERPLVVGFTAWTIQIKAAADLATRIKDVHPSVLIGVGGPHPNAIPRETLEEFPVFDFAVPGEAEEILPRILNELDALDKIPGVVTKNSIPLDSGKSPGTAAHNLLAGFTRPPADSGAYPRVTNLDDIPFPAWGGFNLMKFVGGPPHRTFRELPISTSRGCPYSCHFCSRTFGQKRIVRSVDSVIEEMWKDVIDFGATSITFLDETFAAGKSWAEQLFNRMIDEGLNKRVKWSCEKTVHVNDPEYYKLMRKAGCYWCFFGFETANKDMLQRVGKGLHDKSQMREAVDAAYAAGIVITGSFILNLAGETEETAWESIEMAKELYPKVHSLTFPIATPFPGTEIRSWAQEGKYGLKILSNDWDRYGKQEGVMESEALPLKKLKEIQAAAYEAIPKKNMEEFENEMWKSSWVA